MNDFATLRNVDYFLTTPEVPFRTAHVKKLVKNGLHKQRRAKRTQKEMSDIVTQLSRPKCSERHAVSDATMAPPPNAGSNSMMSRRSV